MGLLASQIWQSSAKTETAKKDRRSAAARRRGAMVTGEREVQAMPGRRKLGSWKNEARMEHHGLSFTLYTSAALSY